MSIDLSARLRRSVGAAALLPALAGACGEGPPLTLESCPASSEPWIAAGRAAETPETREALVVRARGLQETCVGAWAPHWLEGDTVAKLGRIDEAVAAYEQAHDLARERDDPAGVSLAANPLASHLRRRGEAARAEPLYREAIEAARRAERGDLESYARANAAGLYVDRGEFARAIEEMTLAERGLAELGQAGQQRRLAYNRATLHMRLGDVERARRALDETYSAATAERDVALADHAAVALGALHLTIEAPDEARAWYARASEASASVYRRARFGLGRVALMLGDHERAIEILSEVLALAEDDDPGLALLVECFIGEGETKTGRTDTARERLTRVIDESDRLDAGKSRWIARWLLGRLELFEGRRDEAERRLRAAVDMVEEQGEELDRSDEGLRYLRERFEPYVDLSLARIGASSGVQRLDARAANGLLDVFRRAMARGLAQLSAERRNAVPAADLAAIQSGLGDGEWLLAYLLGDTAGVMLAISRDAVFATGIEGRATLREPVETYRRALTEGTGSRAGLAEDELRAGRDLHRALIAPFEETMREARRIYVVPDRELALLPFSALPVAAAPAGTSETTYLGELVEIALLPLPAAPAADEPASAPVLLAGLPEIADGELSDLVWSAHEIERLEAIWSGAPVTVITGERLTTASLVEPDSGLASHDEASSGVRARGSAARTANRFRTLHFASHARASVRDPSRSGVVLSNGEMLGLDAISKLSLDHALVVLSACRTGEGEIVPGEGVVGLRWAFLGAGADAVVASLWSVDDAATSELMIAFHERLRAGVPVVTALSEARRDVRAVHPHPRYWAPFVVVVRPGGESGPE